MGEITTAKVHSEEAEKLVASVHAWHHQFEIAPGVVTPGSYNPGFLWNKLELSDDLSGYRVLDIGPSDGFFSLNLRRRGAEVVAVDYRPKSLHGFAVMERISGLDFDYRQVNLYEISPMIFGMFDIVLFLGVLYHLPDMLKALSIVRSVCKDWMFLETQCDIQCGTGESVARYYKGDTLNKDLTNFWVPSLQCVDDMLHDTGFGITRQEAWGDRYFAACRICREPSQSEKIRLAYGAIE